MTTALLSIWTNTLYDCLISTILWFLLNAFGWSRIASSAYQRRPTWGSHSQTSSIKQLVYRTYSKFANSQRTQLSPVTLDIISTTYNCLMSPSYPERNFGGNQLPDGSISLSHLYPHQTNDLHVSIATALHFGFPKLQLVRE